MPSSCAPSPPLSQRLHMSLLPLPPSPVLLATQLPPPCSAPLPEALGPSAATTTTGSRRSPLSAAEQSCRPPAPCPAIAAAAAAAAVPAALPAQSVPDSGEGPRAPFRLPSILPPLSSRTPASSRPRSCSFRSSLPLSLSLTPTRSRSRPATPGGPPVPAASIPSKPSALILCDETNRSAGSRTNRRNGAGAEKSDPWVATCRSNASHGGLDARVGTWATTHRQQRARVSATFMRRTSARKPTEEMEAEAEGEKRSAEEEGGAEEGGGGGMGAAALARTALKMTMSASRPWWGQDIVNWEHRRALDNESRASKATHLTDSSCPVPLHLW